MRLGWVVGCSLDGFRGGVWEACDVREHYFYDLVGSRG